MRGLLRLATLLLPLVGLGYLWLHTYRVFAEGVEWQVPVSAYDPRDMLKGHFVQFTYQWPVDPQPVDPQSVGAASARDDAASPPEGLCLEGHPPIISHATRLFGAAQRATCASVVSESYPGAQAGHVPANGQLYVSEAEAKRLQAALSDPARQAVLHFRLRPDGVIAPLGLSFAARKIPADPTHAPG